MSMSTGLPPNMFFLFNIISLQIIFTNISLLKKTFFSAGFTFFFSRLYLFKKRGYNSRYDRDKQGEFYAAKQFSVRSISNGQEKTYQSNCRSTDSMTFFFFVDRVHDF